MKLVLVLFLLASCACAHKPYAWFSLKRYENPKGGIVEFRHPKHRRSPRYAKKIAAAEQEKFDLMKKFCAPEPYKILSEGSTSRATGSSSTPIGGSVFTSVSYNETPYIEFRCGS